MPENQTPPPFPEYPEIMTVAQVASALHLSHGTVCSLLMRGELPGKKVGMKWAIRKENLLAYLNNP